MRLLETRTLAGSTSRILCSDADNQFQDMTSDRCTAPVGSIDLHESAVMTSHETLPVVYLCTERRCQAHLLM